MRRRLEKTIDGGIVEKRFFKPPVRGEYDPLSVPPEWSQWLHKTRAEVPSLEDIARGVASREALARRVAELEAEDARRRFQVRIAGSQNLLWHSFGELKQLAAHAHGRGDCTVSGQN